MPEPIAVVPVQQTSCERAKRVAPGERELYRWVLRSFAEHGLPPVDELAEAASTLGLDVEQALARLAEEDLVHASSDSRIAVAYPFSGEPTPHRVEIAGGSEVFAMCAVDALGIPYMLGRRVQIQSHDPIGGDEICVQVDPDASLEWEPEPAVVLWGATGCEGPSSATCCQFVHFFASAESAQRYAAESAVSGQILSMPAAAEVGRAILGALLAPD